MSVHRYAKRAMYLAVFIAVVDQLSKWWLLNKVALQGKNIAEPQFVEKVTPFFNLVLTHNKGVTFGLLNAIDHQYMPFILAGAAAVILFFLGRWLLRTHSLLVAIGLGSVIGGAIGNLIDRLRYGSVVDFLDFFYRDYHWYAFNVADASIVIGVGLLILDSLIRAP
jgi:signal peptidase II